MHFLRRYKNIIKLMRPNCTVKLMHTVIVPEKKSFYRDLYRGQYLSFSFRKSPTRKLDVASVGLWDRLEREINFKNLKNTW